MFAQIVAGTPFWVPIVFLILVAYGMLLRRTRTLNAGKVAMLPIIMILLSVGGVLSSFGLTPVAIIAWLVGFGLANALNQVLRAPAGVTYDDATRLFSVPGSWTPFALMMMIFFAKYIVGATTAMQPAVVGTSWFGGTLSLVFGLLSGTFFARALQIWSAKRAPAAVGDSMPSWNSAR